MLVMVGELPESATTVTLIEPETEGSAADVAIIVALSAFGGAVNNPVALMVPIWALPPGISPEVPLATDHVTAWFEVPVTLSVNWKVSPVPIETGVVGFTVTVTPETIETLELEKTVVFATAVATTTKLLGVGGLDGAV